MSVEEFAKSTRPSVVSLDELRAVFETNVFGVVAVTQAMLPLLREAPAARIVNLSSGAGSLTLNSDPGFTKTNLNNYEGTQTVKEGAREPVRLALLGPDGPTGTFSNTAGVIPW
jgi:NAD(P)-dependent dehydrogenase (short-subunit alcohol dehydrogenase family)